MIDKTSWTEEDVQNLIDNQVKENINLDYKASDSLAKMNDNCKKELSKDVSAFANSDGGILVYGVVEEGNIPVKIDNGCDPIKVTREWIEQVIDSRIQRKISGIRIHQIALSGENAGRVVYVISIPQSVDAPHMADDNRYYKRYNFKSAPMEDYEVRDVRRRNDSPNLKIEYVLKENKDSNKVREVAVHIYNTSPVIAEHYLVRLYIDDNLYMISEGKFDLKDSLNKIKVEGKEIPVKSLSRKFTVPTLPLWENEKFNITTFKFLPEETEKTYHFAWRVSGPGFNNFEFATLTL